MPVNLLGPNDRNAWQADDTDGAVSLVRPERPPRPVTVPAEPCGRLTLDLARTALLVVDMQKEFCAPDGRLGTNGADLTRNRAPIPVIADLLPPLRAAGVPVVWLGWGNRPDRANLPPNLLHVYDPRGRGTGLGAPLRGDPSARTMERGSRTVEIVDGLDPAPGDLHVAKHRMSGFWDTELDSVLRQLRADTLLFTGVNADQCVMSTLTDAAGLGYDVVLLEDAVGTTSPPYCLDATLYNVRTCFGFTARAAELGRAAGAVPAG